MRGFRLRLRLNRWSNSRTPGIAHGPILRHPIRDEYRGEGAARRWPRMTKETCMRQRRNIARKIFGLILVLVGFTVVEVRADDTWTPTSTINAPSARSGHMAVWTGTEMIIWGGDDNTGRRYNPATDTWTPTSTINAPSARSNHTAIWTGKEMIICGGFVRSLPSPHGTGRDPEAER